MLIVIDILTKVISGNKVKSSLKYCDDIKTKNLVMMNLQIGSWKIVLHMTILLKSTFQ